MDQAQVDPGRSDSGCCCTDFRDGDGLERRTRHACCPIHSREAQRDGRA